MSDHSDPEQATRITADELRSIAETLSLQKLSRLSLPEIEAVVKLVAQVVPAGNVPGMILSGLARLAGRKPPLQKVQQDVNALFQGMEQVLDRAVYTAVFAVPARVIWAYQNMMRLAGIDPDAAFPEGTWQFYVDYALREDTARHANETHGFDSLLRAHGIQLRPVDRLTAWAMTAITCLHQFDALLANEWRERTAIALLQKATRNPKYDGLYREWEAKRPYRRGAEAAHLDYPAYRRQAFDNFLQAALQSMPESVYRGFQQKLNAAEQTDLPAYLRQMSILASLEPGPYGETRLPFERGQARLGLIHRGAYFLLPIGDANGRPLDVLSVRGQIAALFASEADRPPARLELLARTRRTSHPELRLKLDPARAAALDRLRFAPILLNADPRPRALPLAQIRQAERGIGSHALTIFDTGETFVFDQSHIFFDGAWGAALAEILTNEALSWARYLSMLPTPVPAESSLLEPLDFQFQPAEVEAIQQAPRVMPEASAETDQVNIKACLNLRKLFKQRNDLLQLTVNDLLVLYRAIHAVTYQPSPALAAELEKLSAANADAANAVRASIEETQRASPSILIPVDASQQSPRDRVYPLNVEVPLAELDLLELHARSIQSLDAYESAAGDRGPVYAKFDAAQRTYLASLAGFGAFMKKARGIAIQGQSASVGAIKLLAGLHPALQRLLDKIPDKLGFLNNLIKGREVFSNVGAVAPASTLTRFITAKDDNEQKRLAWGAMTDASGVMILSLRDFRPHVAPLLACGRRDLADLAARDYLESYAVGFNAWIRDVWRITQASRETQSSMNEKKQKHPVG